jgi:hypothetical protein
MVTSVEVAAAGGTVVVVVVGGTMVVVVVGVVAAVVGGMPNQCVSTGWTWIMAHVHGTGGDSQQCKLCESSVPSRRIAHRSVLSHWSVLPHPYTHARTHVMSAHARTYVHGIPTPNAVWCSSPLWWPLHSCGEVVVSSVVSSVMCRSLPLKRGCPLFSGVCRTPPWPAWYPTLHSLRGVSVPE